MQNKMTAGEIEAMNEEFVKDYELAKAATQTMIEHSISLELMPEAVLAALNTSSAEILATMCTMSELDDESAALAFDMAIAQSREHFKRCRNEMREAVKKEAA